MRYYAPILCLLAVSRSVCTSTDIGHSPLPNLLAPVGAFAPKKAPLEPATLKEYGTSAHRLSRRETCALTGFYMCANGGCCQAGYNCDTDGVSNYCCRIGQTCIGNSGVCPTGTSSCEAITGQTDECCPIGTHVCDVDISGQTGCRLLGSGISSLCRDSNYFPCDDGSGCCRTGQTCIPNSDYCEEPCDSGYMQCSFGGCCEPGYYCNAGTETCRRNTSYVVSVSPSTRRSSTSSRSSSRPSSRTTFLDPTPTFDVPTLTPTDDTNSSTSSRQTSSTPTTTPSPVAIVTTPVGGDSNSLNPSLFGLVAVGLGVLFQL